MRQNERYQGGYVREAWISGGGVVASACSCTHKCTAVLAELDQMRQQGATLDEVADAFPPELLQHVGYYGAPEGAAVAFRRLVEGLDVAIVRVVASRPGIASIRAALHACQPELVKPQFSP
jgi:hypothetical protein